MKVPSSRVAFGLLAAVVVAWGLTWPVAKLLLAAGVTPLWLLAIRSLIATATLAVVMLATGNLIWPRKGDWPIVFGIALLHMTCFTSFMTVGLQHVPVGRSIVLGYSTPLWVVPGAILFLGERLTTFRAVGVVTGLAGILVLFDPWHFDWRDRDALLGNGLLLAASLAWAASMLQIRAHRWVSTPFQLVFWETVVASVTLNAAAAGFETMPSVVWDGRLALLIGYLGIVGVALAYWAMAVVNRSLPAVTASLGMLATPPVGILASMLMLGEPFDPTLLAALALISAGIGLDILGGRRALRAPAVGPPHAK